MAGLWVYVFTSLHIKFKQREKKHSVLIYFWENATRFMFTEWTVGIMLAKGNGFVLSENCSLMFPCRHFISKAGCGPKFPPDRNSVWWSVIDRVYNKRSPLAKDLKQSY